MTQAIQEAARSWRTRTGAALVLLLAALAALFAVQWKASADVDATDFTVSGPLEDDCSTPLSGSVNPGTVVCYVIATDNNGDGVLDPLSGYTAPLDIVVTLPTGASGIVFAPASGPTPTFPSPNTARYSSPNGSIFSLNVKFTVTADVTDNDDDVCDPGELCFTVDDASAQPGQVVPQGTYGGVDVVAVDATLAKTGSPPTLSALGGAVTWTITYNHGANTDPITKGGTGPNGSWTLTDTFASPPYTSVQSITVTVSDAGSDGDLEPTDFVCTPATLPAPATTTVSCSFTGGDGGTIGPNDVVTVTIVANVGPNNAPEDRDVCNSATVNAVTNLGAEYSREDDSCVAQDRFAPLNKSADETWLSAAGGEVTWTVTYAHPSNLPSVAAGDLVIQDTVNDPAISQVTEIDYDDEVLTCSTEPALPAAPPVTVTCVNTVAVNPGDTVSLDITTDVSANGSTNPRTVRNTANVSAVVAEVTFQHSATATVAQAGADLPVKQPLLAWAGQVVALEHNWGVDECEGGPDDDEGQVVYTRQNGRTAPAPSIPAARGRRVAASRTASLGRCTNPRTRARWTCLPPAARPPTASSSTT
jgi:hypothetical protein